MKSQARIVIKFLEFLGCVACLITKYFTDIEARRVFLTRQKYSREWSLLNNIFWNVKGDAFAFITFGGFSIITLLFGISRCIDSKSRPSLAEKFFLTVGMLMFFGVGGLVFASIDQVPDELIDNAIILGCLSFVVAFLFLIDLTDPLGKRKTGSTQTHAIDDQDTRTNKQHQKQLISTISTVDKQLQKQQQQQKRQNFQNYVPTEQLQHEQHQQNYNSYNPQTQQQRQVFPSHYVSEEFVQTQTLPTVQQPIFAKVKQPTILNHFETEPYKKILSRSTQQIPQQHQQQQQQQQQQQYSSVAHKRYQDPPNFNDNISYAEDFNMQNKQTYYPGQRVDQGKMIIRDYSKQKPDAKKCNCNEQHEQHDEDNEESPIKSGYVSHVAKLWDNRMKSSHKISPTKKNDMQGLSTIV
ncbi:unnamed protein product [Diamesa serratosioi]